MSACSELMCSQLLVPLAGLTSTGQAGLSCSLGRGRQGKLCIPALQWQGCRRRRWCRFSARPRGCCLTFSITSCSWNQLRFYKEAERRNKTLTKKILYFLLWCCLAFVFAPLVACIAFFIPQTVEEFPLRCTLQSTENGWPNWRAGCVCEKLQNRILLFYGHIGRYD